MKATELIRRLEHLARCYGDLDVAVWDDKEYAFTAIDNIRLRERTENQWRRDECNLSATFIGIATYEIGDTVTCHDQPLCSECGYCVEDVEHLRHIRDSEHGQQCEKCGAVNAKLVHGCLLCVWCAAIPAAGGKELNNGTI